MPQADWALPPLTLASHTRLYSMEGAHIVPPTSSSPRTRLPTDTRVLNGSAAAVWHKSAPRALRRAFASADHADAFADFAAHLATRKRPTDPAQLLPAHTDTLAWALPTIQKPPLLAPLAAGTTNWSGAGGEGASDGPRADRHASHTMPAWLDHALQRLARRQPPDPSLEKDLLAWLAESAGATAHPAYALEALACGRAIARLANLLSPDVWWALLDHLLATALDAQTISLEDDPLAHQLLAGELALTLAYLLPEITPCRKLKSPARRALSSGLVELLDGEGLPHARHLGLLRPLLACWTRCHAVGDRLKGGCWTKAASYQYEWLLRQALALLRHDGTQVFSHPPAATVDTELFAAALALAGDRHDRAIAALVLPKYRKPKKKHASQSALPDPALHSEWAGLAVLRPQWARSSPRLTVAYPDQHVQIELGCGRDLLWSGIWQLDVHIDGQPATPQSDWQQLCWISDDQVDYLELQIDLTARLLVQRQMLLARQDHLLLLADAVLARQAHRLEYRACLPLCPGISFRRAKQSREGHLSGSKRRALVLPLALPEWLADRRVGRLTQTSNGLELHQSADARRLYAPMLFDLDRGRLTRRTTWRQLTVAESLAVQPAEVAVGYRAAIGKRQWLIYRSLAHKANRTLLGHNLSTEMLLARFSPSGQVQPLLEIE